MLIAQSVSQKIPVDITAQAAVADWPFKNVGPFVGNIVIAGMVLAGLSTFLMLVYGGVQYITSGGDKAQTESARNKITYALIGLVIVIGSYGIIKLIEAFFGLNILQSRFPTP